MIKDPANCGKILLNGRVGGGIYFTEPDGSVTTIVNDEGQLVDTGSTFEDANLTGTTTVEIMDVSGVATFSDTVDAGGDVNVTGNLTVGGTTIVNGVVTETYTMATDKKIQFRDTGLFIHSNADGKLTISSDGVGADDITLSGTVTLNADLTLGAATGIVSGTANGIVPLEYAAVQNAVSTATAIGVVSYNTTIDSTTGPLALTLAAGTFKGQRRRVQMIVDNGDATLTFNGTATIVFADVGDVAELIYTGAAWVPVALYNIVDGATAPAYTPA